MVIVEKYRQKIPVAAKKQKLAMASSEPVEPSRKAITLVIEVMVMEVPACIIPILILLGTGSVVSV